jgi:hypothetical protein
MIAIRFKLPAQGVLAYPKRFDLLGLVSAGLFEKP